MNLLKKLEEDLNQISPYASGTSREFQELIAKIMIEILRESIKMNEIKGGMNNG